jgi:hypothetical protein
MGGYCTHQDLQPLGGVRPSPLSIAVTALGPQSLLLPSTASSPTRSGRADDGDAAIVVRAQTRRAARGGDDRAGTKKGSPRHFSSQTADTASRAADPRRRGP